MIANPHLLSLWFHSRFGNCTAPIPNYTLHNPNPKRLKTDITKWFVFILNQFLTARYPKSYILLWGYISQSYEAIKNRRSMTPLYPNKSNALLPYIPNFEPLVLVLLRLLYPNHIPNNRILTMWTSVLFKTCSKLCKNCSKLITNCSKLCNVFFIMRNNIATPFTICSKLIPTCSKPVQNSISCRLYMFKTLPKLFKTHKIKVIYVQNSFYFLFYFLTQIWDIYAL